MPQPDTIFDLLVELYGIELASLTSDRLHRLIDRYRDPFLHRNGMEQRRGSVTQQDSILITYGDQITQPGVMPLQSLGRFCDMHLKGLISGIHILPFFPYSSDDGFSVIEYKSVDPQLGTWEDIVALRDSFRLMFDAVLNHVSVQSEWFSGFLRGDPLYDKYFIEVNGSPDLSNVVRPRALPLLTRYQTPTGSKSIWTTFSTDQVDLNYHNPEVLHKIIELLLYYASQGAEFLRLDAVAYLWKEIGTSCIHLPQTHHIIQLFRSVLDSVYPQVLLITETNVPHLDNVSYFGDGTNEAQLVYNFALPPLVLHALNSGSAHTLSEWAGGLELPSSQVTFFNFLASHDGIGINPARGILTQKEIEAMVAEVQAHGGLISYKQNSDGTQSPYELNINYFDALSDPHKNETEMVRVDRFMAAQAIMLALRGVPGVYFHSLFGSRGWPEGVLLTGRNRTINRQKLDRLVLEQELQNPESRRHAVFSRYTQLLKARASSTAFHPTGKQEILAAEEAIFALLRISPDGGQRVLCLHNVSDTPQVITIKKMDDIKSISPAMLDLITGRSITWNLERPWVMQPYQVYWLKLN